MKNFAKFLVLSVAIGLQVGVAHAEAPQSCGRLQSLFESYANGAIQDLTWTPERQKKLVQRTQQYLDPMDLVAIGDEDAPDFAKYLAGIERNDCSHFESLVAEAKSSKEEFRKRALSSIRAGIEGGPTEMESEDKLDSKKNSRDERANLFIGNYSRSTVKIFTSHQLEYSKDILTEFLAKAVSELAFPTLSDSNQMEEWITRVTLAAFDPFSTYMSDEEYRRFNESVSGEFKGLGVNVTAVPDGLFIFDVVKNGPAERSGRLKKGDIIVKINGAFSVADHSFEEALYRLRGKDSTVTLSVLRSGKLVVVEAERGVVEEPGREIQKLCDYKKFSPVLYCHLPIFSPDSTRVLKSAISTARSTASARGIQLRDGLILDIRDNPGGRLEEAIELSALLTQTHIPLGIPIAYEKQKQKTIPLRPVRFREGYIEEAQNLKIYPLMLLVNEHSASASEIVSGNVKASGAGLVVSDGADKTYGKGSVQIIEPQEPELGVLRRTRAVYLTMDGRAPHKRGVTPHVILPLTQPAHEENEELFTVENISLNQPLSVNQVEMFLSDQTKSSALFAHTSVVKLKTDSWTQKVEAAIKAKNRDLLKALQEEKERSDVEALATLFDLYAKRDSVELNGAKMASGK